MIVPMKKAKVFVLKDQEHKLKRSLQRYGVLMITNENSQQIDVQFEDSLISRANRIIKELSKYEEKPKFFKPKFHVVDYDRFSDVKNEQFELLEQIELTLANASELKSVNSDLTEKIKEYQPWTNLSVSSNDISNLTYSRIYLGQVLTQDVESFDEFLKSKQLLFETYGSDANGLAYAVVSENDVLSELVSANFKLVSLPNSNALIADEVENLNNQIKANEQTLIGLEEKISSFAANLDDIRLLSDQMLSQKELKKVHGEQTERTVYFEGWVRSDQEELLEKAVSEVTSDYEIELRDPLPQETPPTQHKNNKFVQPFETITDMFSVPNYNEIDPNPIMSIWYWLFFGMMMGDWGYGLVMALLLGMFLLIKKPKGEFKKLVTVLFYSSFPSIIFGILYGSVFGMSFDIGTALFNVKFQVFDPMNDPIPMLIASLAVGAVHIFVALIIKAIKMGREKDYLGILAESVSWMLIIPGLAIILAFQKLALYGYIAAGLGALMVLAFSGRGKKNIFKRVTSGLGGLYGITGYLSDILSYSRILALALSSGVIAYSMNTIGNLLIGPWYGYIFGIIVFIIGHVFNLAMGLLSAYVHDSRLQYIEFFGKFYEGGGYQFTPLRLQYVHIYEVKDNL